MRGKKHQHSLHRYHAAAAALRSAGVTDGGAGASYSAKRANVLAFVKECHTFEPGSRRCHEAAARATRSSWAAGGGTRPAYSAKITFGTLRYGPRLELCLANAALRRWGAPRPGPAYSAALLREQAALFLVAGLILAGVGHARPGPDATTIAYPGRAGGP